MYMAAVSREPAFQTFRSPIVCASISTWRCRFSWICRSSADSGSTGSDQDFPGMDTIVHAITAITASIEAMLIGHTGHRLRRMRVFLCLILVMSVEIVATRHRKRATAG